MGACGSLGVMSFDANNIVQRKQQQGTCLLVHQVCVAEVLDGIASTHERWSRPEALHCIIDTLLNAP
jgi:hypothetical protein